MNGLWSLMIGPVLALHDVAKYPQLAHPEISFIRRESFSHKSHKVQPTEASLLNRGQLEEDHSPDSSQSPHVAGSQTIVLANIRNKQNIYQEFNITFKVKFGEGAFSPDHVPQHNHQMLLKTDNDAIEIEAYGSHYAPNDRKIVASMRTQSGLPGPGGGGVAGNGSEMIDTNGHVVPASGQDDGKLYSHRLQGNETDWYEVSLIKTHGGGSKLGKLALIVNGEKVECEVREVQGFLESRGDFLMKSVPSVTKIEYGADAGSGDLGLQGEMKDITVQVPATTGQMNV